MKVQRIHAVLRALTDADGQIRLPDLRRMRRRHAVELKVLADKLNPRDVKKAPGAKEKLNCHDLLGFLNGEFVPRKDLFAAIRLKFDYSDRTFDDKMRELESLGLIERKEGCFKQLHNDQKSSKSLP